MAAVTKPETEVVQNRQFISTATAVTSLFSSYLLIVVLIIYSFAQDGRRKGGVSEPKVIQKLPFIRVGRYGYFRSEWTSLTY